MCCNNQLLSCFKKHYYRYPNSLSHYSVHTFIKCRRVVEEALLLIGEKRIGHPDFLHHLLAHGDLLVLVGELFDNESGIGPELPEVDVNRKVLQRRKRPCSKM